MKTNLKITSLSVIFFFIGLSLIAQPKDVIMWYDCDNGTLINSRPDNGWWNLNPEYPGDPTSGGPWRTTTSLLGKYESQDSTVIKQHAYWIKALGCNVLACDLTNSASSSQSGFGADMKRYVTGVNKAFEMQLQCLPKISEFDAPTVYPVVRLTGTNYSNLTLMLNDMYALYKKYPDKWYKFDDNSANKAKPFITIFVDGNLLASWAQIGIPIGAQDDRFNIRYSNGYLLAYANITSLDNSNIYKIPGNIPYWLFVENTQEASKLGYYKLIYKETTDGSGVEQMQTWASIHINGSNWDGLRDIKNGKIPIVRYTDPVYNLKPKVLLVNRFNYALSWPVEPQEGLSRNKSTHIEPNVDWGFLEFNDVANELYNVRAYNKAAPPAAVVDTFYVHTNTFKIKLDGFPLEYRISNSSSFGDTQWTFLDVGNGGIQLGGNINPANVIYIQTRNSFGESPVGPLVLNISNLKIDDTDNGITYAGSWEFGAWDGYYNKSCHYAFQGDASASYTFTGVGIKLIAATGPDHGKSEISIDGGAPTVVDFYSATGVNQVVVFADSLLSYGQHTITIKPIEGKYIDIDALEIMQAIIPDAPTSVSAVSGNMQASVSFTAPVNNGGSAIINYTVTSSPGNITATDNSSPIVVSGLTGGTAYTFTVVATNAMGNSLPSAVSNSVILTGLLDDTDTAITYSGSWEFGAWDGYYNKSCHYAFQGDASASYTFTGTGIKLIAGIGPDHGKSEISIDGGASTIVDFYSATGVNQVVIFADSLLSYGQHTITIKPNEGKYIDIDALEIMQAIIPDAPTSVSAVSGNMQAAVSFTAPVNNGGSAIINYTVTSSPGNITATGNSSPIIVTGLTNGTAYTFTVVATNAMGNSLPSAVSNSVTPPGSLIDDTDAAITYSGSWEFGAWDGYYNKSCHYAFQGDASASYTFTGTGIKLIAGIGPDHAKSEIRIDGDAPKVVDFYSATGVNQVVVFADSLLSYGQHTITIKPIEGKYIDIDAFEIMKNLTAGLGNRDFAYLMLQNSPNPFDLETQISYSLAKSSKVKISVYNLIGQKVATLINEQQLPGDYSIRFDGSGLEGGVYFYQFEAGNYSITKKMILQK